MTFYFFFLTSDVDAVAIMTKRATALLLDFTGPAKGMSINTVRQVGSQLCLDDSQQITNPPLTHSLSLQICTAWNTRPLLVQAEGHELASCLFCAAVCNRSVHVVNVRRRDELEMITMARLQGAHVTCSAAVASLFPFSDTSAVAPVTDKERQTLWEALDEIDILTSGHGLLEGGKRLNCISSSLPLLLTAVDEERLTLEEVQQKLHDNVFKVSEGM